MFRHLLRIKKLVIASLGLFYAIGGASPLYASLYSVYSITAPDTNTMPLKEVLQQIPTCGNGCFVTPDLTPGTSSRGSSSTGKIDGWTFETFQGTSLTPFYEIETFWDSSSVYWNEKNAAIWTNEAINGNTGISAFVTPLGADQKIIYNRGVPSGHGAHMYTKSGEKDVITSDIIRLLDRIRPLERGIISFP